VSGKVSEKDREIKILVNQVAVLDPSAPQASVDEFKKRLLESRPANGYHNGYNGYQVAPAATPKTVPAPKPALATVKPSPVSKPAIRPAKNPLLISFLEDLAPADLAALRQTFSLYPGADEVRFRVNSDGKARVIKTAFQVNNDAALREQLREKFSGRIKISE